MSDEVFGTILKFNKNDIKLELRKRIIAQRPQHLARLDNKIISDTFIYTKGYVDALKEHIAEPFNRNEIRTFIYDRAYEYAIERIEELIVA